MAWAKVVFGRGPVAGPTLERSQVHMEKCLYALLLSARRSPCGICSVPCRSKAWDDCTIAGLRPGDSNLEEELAAKELAGDRFSSPSHLVEVDRKGNLGVLEPSERAGKGLSRDQQLSRHQDGRGHQFSPSHQYDLAFSNPWSPSRRPSQRQLSNTRVTVRDYRVKAAHWSSGIDGRRSPYVAQRWTEVLPMPNGRGGRGRRRVASWFGNRSRERNIGLIVGTDCRAWDDGRNWNG